MTSNKPYLLRAIYEWICDNDCTPYLYVNTATKGIVLPSSLSEESPLILNISPAASMNLKIDSDLISFTARFSGQVFDIFLPLQSILAIVAKETGQGLSFPEEIQHDQQHDQRHDQQQETSASTPADKATAPQSGLKIVK